jgi:hypothetical protein
MGTETKARLDKPRDAVQLSTLPEAAPFHMGAKRFHAFANTAASLLIRNESCGMTAV